jgi:hypothetical protein
VYGLSRHDSVAECFPRWPAISERGRTLLWRVSCSCPPAERPGHLSVNDVYEGHEALVTVERSLPVTGVVLDPSGVQ